MKSKFNIMLTLTLALFFSNCKKEKTYSFNKNENSVQNTALRESDCPNSNQAYLQNDILCFPSMDALRNTIDDIKTKHYLNTDSTDEFKPSRCFESMFPGFVSLRSEIETQRNAWLNTSDADPALDPDNFYVPGIGFRTILNRDGAVKVENIIYYFLNNGDYYEVSDGSWKTFKLLLKESSYSSNLSAVKLYKKSGEIVNMGDGNIINANTASKSNSNSCIGWQQKDKTNNYASNRRVKVKIWVWNYGPIGADVDSETENFRKIGTWIKTNANEINNGICGQIVAGDCYFVGNVCPALKTNHSSSTVGGHLALYGGLVRKVESKKLTANGRARTGNTWSTLLNVSIE